MNSLSQRKRKRRQRQRLLLLFFIFSLVVVIGVVFAVKLTKNLTAYGDKADGGLSSAVLTDTKADSQKNSEKHIISMEGMSQEDIPTGCETVSTVAVLRYYGVNITPELFIEDFLPMMDFYIKNGNVYGADPSEYFAGNPYESGSLGCYCEVIEEACESMQESNYEGTQNLSIKAERGLELSELAEIYVSEDKPVIIWATIDMQETYDGFTYYLESGEEYVWKACEHCMVLCGYDGENYYLMDPLEGGEIVKYKKALVEKRYKEMGEQAVIIEEKI